MEDKFVDKDLPHYHLRPIPGNPNAAPIVRRLFPIPIIHRQIHPGAAPSSNNGFDEDDIYGSEWNEW
jgi:hypothetical protein